MAFLLSAVTLALLAALVWLMRKYPDFGSKFIRPKTQAGRSFCVACMLSFAAAFLYLERVGQLRSGSIVGKGAHHITRASDPEAFARAISFDTYAVIISATGGAVLLAHAIYHRIRGR